MIKKLVSFFALPTLLFCFHLVMVFLGLYKAHPWIDIPMHVLGGVFIAYSFSLAVTYFQAGKILSELNVISRIVFLFALTSLATVIWEFGEFTLDFFFDTVAQASLADTMLDMFLGLVGGAVLIVFLTRGQIKEYVTKDKTPQ
ncbi:MAG: hypothetical protein ACYS32_05430 [Planctomycetota bacterium]